MSTKSDISDEQGYVRAQFCLTTIEAQSGQKNFFSSEFVYGLFKTFPSTIRLVYLQIPLTVLTVSCIPHFPVA